VVLTGCGTSRPARFYTLFPNAFAAPTLRDFPPGTPVVVVQPVDLPPQLRRPQIVTRGAGTALEVGEFDRWAAPLQDEATRVLAGRLQSRLPDVFVEATPTARRSAYELEVQLDVLRFDGVLGEEAVLEATWILRRPGADPEVRSRHLYRGRRPVAASGYDRQVHAMQGLLLELSDRVAESLQGQLEAGEE
jgi:uncharacterized lipoprotein YmbA